MSCWVVPLIAADYLNTSVEDVLRRISNGSIPVRYEDGFTFVDVLPHVNGEPATPTLTYVPADESDFESLASDNHIDREEAGDDPDVLFSWKQARRQAAVRRQRPVAA